MSGLPGSPENAKHASRHVKTRLSNDEELFFGSLVIRKLCRKKCCAIADRIRDEMRRAISSPFQPPHQRRHPPR